MSDELVKVGRIDEFSEGKLKRVRVAGEDVVVANVRGKIYAIGDLCTHKGGPLHEGGLEGAVVICPWHGGQFDVTTGKVISPPPTKDAIPFNVQIRGSDVLVKKK
jgi:nitrite reductase/ring-hydroxylating ferredoxin subunit